MEEKELCERCQSMVYPDEAALSCVHDECPYFEGFEERRMIPVDIFMAGGHRVNDEPYPQAPRRADNEHEED